MKTPSKELTDKLKKLNQDFSKACKEAAEKEGIKLQVVVGLDVLET